MQGIINSSSNSFIHRSIAQSFRNFPAPSSDDLSYYVTLLPFISMMSYDVTNDVTKKGSGDRCLRSFLPASNPDSSHFWNVFCSGGHHLFYHQPLIHLPNQLSIHPPVHTPTHPSTQPTFHPSTNFSIHSPTTHPFIHLSCNSQLSRILCF